MLWWKLGKTGLKLQEARDCMLGQPMLQRRRTRHYNVSCRVNFRRKTTDSRKWRPRRPHSTYNKSILAWTTESSRNPVNDIFNREISSKRLKHMTTWSGNDGLMNSFHNWAANEVVERALQILRKGELEWLVYDSVKRLEYKLGKKTKKSLRSSLVTSVLCDQRESKRHMENWTG